MRPARRGSRPFRSFLRFLVGEELERANCAQARVETINGAVLGGLCLCVRSAMLLGARDGAAAEHMTRAVLLALFVMSHEGVADCA